MRNKLFINLFLVLLFLLSKNLYGKEININASSVEVDKITKVVYAKGNVEIFDQIKNRIFSRNDDWIT